MVARTNRGQGSQSWLDPRRAVAADIERQMASDEVEAARQDIVGRHLQPGTPPSCLRSEAPSTLVRPVRRLVDRGGESGIACRSLGPARSTREEAADMRCAVGSWGGRRPGLGGDVTGTGATSGATAAGGC